MKISSIFAIAALSAEIALTFAKNNNHAVANTRTSSSLQQPTKETMFGTFVNESELLKTSSFPIAPKQLMERAREILAPAVGLGTKDGGACLADDFEFCAAVVGPIGKKEYLGALGSFKLEDAFDISPNFFGMGVDPLQPNRVWFFNRVKGTHTGKFMGAEPTGKEIVYPPQIHHMDFNADGKLKEYGFYTADRRQGNTGGLGGAFGFMYGVGKPLPIPECQPYKRSFRFRLLSFVGGLGQKVQKKKKD
eukprot:CAMPEP_0198145424 /NCGR_PEP_ID=MMETSP1443-20131203/23378_1 /TAXON_ID=186043 /ORGANISM="Entomoneis sp., Strain CCMP2396" /LENGTH=248 /DNA_ID=CAMNT_0043809069 /DNA_START=71 /DNA_END=817 /DNA_ORIENTATION=-